MATGIRTNQNLYDEFAQTAKNILSKHPDLKHSWSVEADKHHAVLYLPKQQQDGFDITVDVSSDGIIVLGNGAHQHFDSSEMSNSEKTTRALGLVRDLLSPDMRIRERRAGGVAYRWFMEVFHDGRWQVECSTRIIFWNYFGNRSEHIFQNTILPRRLASQ